MTLIRRQLLIGLFSITLIIMAGPSIAIAQTQAPKVSEQDVHSLLYDLTYNQVYGLKPSAFDDLYERYKKCFLSEKLPAMCIDSGSKSIGHTL